MSETLVVGKPNAGKTLFVLNFLAYLGETAVSLQVLDSSGESHLQRMPIDRARRELVAAAPHKTLQAQALSVTLTSRKAKKTLQMVDTAGVVDGIADREEVRRAMVDTLTRVQKATMILHVIDASAVGTDNLEALGPVDRELAEFGPLVGPYAILANKMDKTWADSGLRALTEEFSRTRVIPISALTRRGFREVKGFVLRHL